MKARILAAVIFALFVDGFLLGSAWAAIELQSITLKLGWNAVFLEVEPESAAPVDVFAGIANLQSVWMWNPRTSAVEFIQDPDTLVPDQPQWMVYYPNDPILSNLHAIHGETAYLIKLGGTANVTWTVRGEPRVPRIDWKPNSFNLVGFHLADGNEPIFSDFFASSPAHGGQDIYILANGDWLKVQPTDQMKRGESFWVYCKGASEFAGPLSVQLEQGTGLHYGKSLSEQDLILRNNSAVDKSVLLSLSALNTNVYYWMFDPANNVAGWTEFPPSLALAIPAGDFQKLRLGVKRAGLAPETHHGNMAVTDNTGTSIVIPVSVAGMRFAGLWVGDATVTKVSEPRDCLNKGIDPNDAISCPPVATGSEFAFRLILHVDNSNTARFLSQVIQMWQEGTWKPDPNDLSRLIVDEPGHFVLFTDESLIPDYYGSAMRDGQPVGRRISSPAFPNMTDAEAEMPESFNPVPGNYLTKNIVLARDDPTNPFRHLFHPEHKLPEQSFQIQRRISLLFSDEDSEGKPITGVPRLGWGSSEIGGIYKESISGIHRNQLHIEGTFLLRKVSSVETLLMQ